MNRLKFPLRTAALAIHFLPLLFIFSGCNANRIDPKTRVLARVNGVPISLSEFQLNFQQIVAERDETSAANPKILNQLKDRALNETVLMSLVQQEASRRFIKVAKEEVDSRLNSWKDGYPRGGFNEMLQRYNTSEEYLKKRIENQLLVEKVSAEMNGNELLVSDEEMKRYFQGHSDEFVRPERIHALQIVVPSIEEAAKLRQEILSGMITFESAARQFSLSPDASKGGDLGFFSRKEKLEAFDEAFAVPVEAISKPVSSRFGVHLFKVLERQPKKRLSFQEAKPELAKVLRKGKEARAYKEWAIKQLKDAEIYCNEELLLSLSNNG